MKVWYGTEKSYDAVLDAQVQLKAMLKANPGLDAFDPPSLLEVEDGVGLVSIAGSLINGSAGWMTMFGVTGYDDIAEALLEGVSDKSVKSIVLKVNSPGGDAKGVRQLGDLIKNVGTVKPVNVHADTIGSAAYWLGSAGGHITLDEMGLAGSIGALIVHTDRSKQLEQDGVKKTIIRAGINKALANPIEPLTDEARAGLQEIVDTSRDLFVNAVAENRGVTAATVESSFGQGKEFMGHKAVAVGLVDKVGTLEDAIAHSKALQKGFKATKAVKV